MWSTYSRKEKGIKRVGLIINPIAGIGGRVGLKGSDGTAIQQRAIELGAIPRAESRAERALQVLKALHPDLEVITPSGEMGATVASQCGFVPLVIGEINPGATTAEDTRHAAKTMVASQVDLLLFTGGDGTARDIHHAVGEQLPVIGIPAGVKIHSAVFANHPRAAGELASAFLENQSMAVREAEVVDLDEEAYREGIVTTRLYGYLLVPYQRRLVQNQKVPTPESEAAQMGAIAWEVAENMEPGTWYILGPGTTIRAIADHLGVEKTLVGVDVISSQGVVAADVHEEQLLELIENKTTKIIVTPIGGQGFIFGRGNQPISSRVIKRVGRENIWVVCTPEKLHALGGRPLLVDTGDDSIDEMLQGFIAVTTGYREEAVYRIST
jgi:predicted polyphosphate/ATP-dependent NAD kinase